MARSCTGASASSFQYGGGLISDLNETRGELRQLLELADLLRPLAELQRAAENPGNFTGPYPPAEPVPDPDPAAGPTAPPATQPPTTPDTDSQELCRAEA
ncbi:hypothetical protein LT966_31305, partial [Streptomyces griseobrunneus]